MLAKLGLLDQSGLDRFHCDPHALGSAVGGLDADALKIRAEFALRDARHVRADAAALLRLTLAIDDRALDGTATGDCTDSSHDGFELVKGSEVKVGSEVRQGLFWFIAARAGPGISGQGAMDVRAATMPASVGSNAPPRR